MKNQNRAIIKSLAEMAWADGEVTEEERALLFTVCLQMGATEEEMEELREVLGQSQAVQNDGESLEQALPDKASRLSVMRVLLTMSFVDGALDFAEFHVIERKARELGIDSDELEQLRQEAVEAADKFKQT